MHAKPVIAVISVVAVGLLTACGGDSSSSPDGASASSGCDGKVAGPITIKVATHANNDTTKPVNPIKVYQDLVGQFNASVGKQKGITAELVSYPEAGYEKGLTAAVQAGTPPDVDEVDAPFVGSFAWSDVIQPLGTCAGADKLATLLPSVVHNGQYQGKQYTLGAYDSGMGLWVSKAALAKVQARVPGTAADAWTVAEFDTILKDLKAAGYSTPLNIEWGYGAGEWRPFGFGPAVVSAGSSLLKSDFSTADGTLNSPQTVQALTWFQKWAKKGYLDLSTAPGANDANFVQNKSAISWVGHWMGGAYQEALGKDLGLVPLPNFGQGSKLFTGSWSFGMSKSTRDPDAAWAFIDYMTSAEASKKLSDSESAIPAVKSVYEADPAYQKGGQRYLYAENLNDSSVAVPRPQSPAYLVTRDEFSTAFGDIIDGADVRTSLDKAVSKIDADIKANRGYPSS
jgi:multiple sugar transport system substrate-binding protein